MIVLGVILLLIGFIAAVHIIWILSIIALVVGAVFAIAGFTGHQLGGRKRHLLARTGWPDAGLLQVDLGW
jgi:hypothetical protein